MSSTTTEQQGTATRQSHLVTSGSTLLSGQRLSDCQTPQDETCSGGIASVSALSRYYAPEGNVFTLQRFDKSSPFVNMHPLQWLVNRLIISQIFNIPVFMEAPSILNQNKVDSNVSQRDISGLQSFEMPLLLSNVEVPPTNSWHPFVKNVHFDGSTGLAIVAIIDNGVPFTVDQIESGKAAMNLIQQVNQRNGCFERPTPYQEYILQTPGLGLDSLNNNNNNNNNEATNTATTGAGTDQCWVPVIIFSDIGDTYWSFLRAISAHSYPPQFLVTLDTVYETFPTPQLYEDTGVWVSSCGMNTDSYCHHAINIAEKGNGTREMVIQNITLIEDDIRNLNETMKDSTWDSHIEKLAILANDARLHDPIVGETGFIPVVRVGSYRACKAGECPVGNLFTDALRWQSGSDIAFTSSGGYRGPGKEAGPTRFGDLYAALPFPNTICTGTMTGISLFHLLNYTTSVATFEGEDTDNGGRLLQVSGMRITYNTELQGSRLISVAIWDREKEMYEPIDRLRLYTFATDSYVCGGYDPYPDLTVTNLEFPGESPGKIGDVLHQNIVADYLRQLDEPYDTSYQGRLRNDTSATEFMNLVQTEENCLDGSIWDEPTLSCIACPTYENVIFSDQLLEFRAQHNVETIQSGRVLLLNREPYPVMARPSSLPKWVDMVSAVVSDRDYSPLTTASRISLEPGDSLVLNFDVNPSAVVGTGGDRTALGSISFGIEDGGSYPGCSGLDSPSFDVMLQISPPEDYNHLGNMRYVGFALSAVVFIIAIIYMAWVYQKRFARVVKVLQPIFLCTVCFGVCVMASSMIPLSFDDEIISVRGCGIACMSVPWLLSMGFTIAFAALYAKLLRINKLFNQRNFRRIVVEPKNVMAPFSVLFTLNFGLLLVWTLVDPLRWKRVAINGQEWNTVGKCSGGKVATIMASLIAAANLGSLICACVEAVKARKISDEFSESKYIGVAVYGWLQIIVVALPVLFLIDTDNNTATYFLQVILIFVLSLSMLLIVSLPAFINTINQVGKSLLRIRVSGLQREVSEGRMNVRASLAGSHARRSTQAGGADSAVASGVSTVAPIPEGLGSSEEISAHSGSDNLDVTTTKV